MSGESRHHYDDCACLLKKIIKKILIYKLCKVFIFIYPHPSSMWGIEPHVQRQVVE